MGSDGLCILGSRGRHLPRQLRGGGNSGGYIQWMPKYKARFYFVPFVTFKARLHTLYADGGLNMIKKNMKKNGAWNEGKEGFAPFLFDCGELTA